MRRLLEDLDRRQRQFAALPFFRRLEGPGTIDDVRAFVPRLTFFAMGFQDLLRLNEALITEPSLRAFAGHHRAEDAGHQLWFLHDVAALGVEPGVGWVFDAAQAPTRDTVYRLVGEIFRASDDRVRVLLLLLLEATGRVFFARIPGFLRRGGNTLLLTYFAEPHLEVERDHSMFDDSSASRLAAIEVPPAVETEALAMLERGFAAMTAMVTDFERSIVEARAAPAPGESPASPPRGPSA